MFQDAVIGVSQKLGYPASLPLIVVCVATFRRPAFLEDLLDSLLATRMGPFRVQFVIVDNDETGATRQIVSRFQSRVPLPVKYVVEPRRGHCSSRNRSIREAEALGAEYIAFVDDDQLVEAEWLMAMFQTAVSHSLDFVKAQDLPKYEADVPEWVIQCGYFGEVPRHTGMPIRNFGENGSLIRMSAILAVPEGFDERFNLTGGGDGMLIARLHALGFRSGGCRESILFERVPSSRATAKWMIMRSYRCGIVKGIVTRLVEPTFLRSIKWFGIALAYTAFHVGMTVVSFPFGKAKWVPNVARITMGVGIIKGLGQGLKAFHFREYEVTHGQ